MPIRDNYSTRSKQPIHSIDGKIIGRIDGNVLRKRIRGSKHILRTPKAIAIDANAFDREIAPTCKNIEVHDTESNEVYTSTIDNFSQYKMTLDRGHGRQYALPLRYWEFDGKQSNFQPAKPEPDPNSSKQRSFSEVFDG
ncbi:MAG: hypothetical protein HOC20_11520 [Chloroflexi bacterium]|nr:hypothetical protein [Chloroflexota bacterium]